MFCHKCKFKARSRVSKQPKTNLKTSSSTRQYLAIPVFRSLPFQQLQTVLWNHWSAFTRNDRKCITGLENGKNKPAALTGTQINQLTEKEWCNIWVYIYIFVSISYFYLKNGQISNCDAIHQFSVTSGKFAAESSAAELVKLDWTSLATVEISQHAAQQHLVHYGTGESVTRGQGYKDGTGLAFSAVLGDNAKHTCGQVQWAMSSCPDVVLFCLWIKRLKI